MQPRLFFQVKKTIEYLESTNRSDIASIINKNLSLFQADAEVMESPDRFYDKIINIDLSSLCPSVAGPHTPDIVNDLDSMQDYLIKNNYPVEISAALIGSCTNSSYEDIKKVLYLADFSMKNNLKCKVPLFISPGSASIANLLYKHTDLLEYINAKILSNACGPCIGQWKREAFDGKTNSIITSYNRNFPGRNDGNRNFSIHYEPITSLCIFFDR